MSSILPWNESLLLSLQLCNTKPFRKGYVLEPTVELVWAVTVPYSLGSMGLHSFCNPTVLHVFYSLSHEKKILRTLRSVLRTEVSP